MQAYLVGKLEGIRAISPEAAKTAFTETGGYDDYGGSRWHTQDKVEVPEGSKLVRCSPHPGMWRDAVKV